MKNIEVVVFFSDNGEQLFVDRGGGLPAPLSRCGVGKSRRFVFYDQIHTTGTWCSSAKRENFKRFTFSRYREIIT